MMTANPDLFKMSPAREREHQIMLMLAKIVRGEFSAGQLKNDAELRLVGYAAALVEGSVADEHGNLKSFISNCRSALPRLSDTVVQAKDPVQARWAAEFHLDCSKFRREFPLYLLR
ncbi:hypothetical protein [Pseudosulfitobacter pseudonitzschiae]|uniref:hypothetical protein n=1 Tax=Pseudosulfitobacter pseudonitzschiae TaxID=1402135 RepID=UPI003B820B12